MAYTGGHRETDEVQAKLKKAYFDGHEAGAHRTAQPADGAAVER